MRSTNADLLIVGSGSLAREFCLALSLQMKSIRIVIAARSPHALAEIETLARARSASVGGFVVVSAHLLQAYTLAEFIEIASAYRPRVVLIAVSLQSPWSFESSASRWARIITDGGFGITIALQAKIALTAGEAFNQAGIQTALVNACYPDAVNALLCARGIDVLCGVGNVAILAALLAASARSAGTRIQVVAHHFHIVALLRSLPGPNAIIRVRGLNSGDAQKLLKRHLAQLPGARLNALTAVTALPLLAALLGGGSCVTHLPGPLGLPGGYPVSVRGRVIALSLPSGISLSTAVNANQRAASADGVIVSDDGKVEFSERASSALVRYAPSLSKGFGAYELEEAADAFVRLREGLQ